MTSQLQGAATLRVCGATDVGLQREQNQDTFVIADLDSGEVNSPCVEVELSVSNSGYLLLVCDGMGGAPAGDTASHIAAASIKERLVDAGQGVSERPAEALEEAVAAANKAILDDVSDEPRRKGMGTTCTAAVVLPGTLTVAQVGDSRAYLLRDGKLWALTKDQSLAARLVDEGVLTTEGVSTFAYRHVLLQALGGKKAVAPVINQYRLVGGDRILLCSDGLHGLVPDGEIQAALTDTTELATTTRTLVERALAAGGKDNVTVVVAEYRVSDAPNAPASPR
ncbi:MAG: protein phosphatase 2C domain-containing protein [Myxococcales bacterium]